ncbi:MAG: class 1 fructose-bisphosphatase [Nitrospirae bacterium]|nr:class 1 fructose-bisphosphatase [Nitrospirota bacterium]MBI3594987.1 class 1 fructose-bisphosphatase [Nitrospirota bacterium]
MLLTLDQHIIQQQRKFPKSTGDLSDLLYDIALAGKLVSREVNRAGLVDILGSAGRMNVQNEEVQKLDIFANTVFLKIFEQSSRVCTFGSEEDEQVVSLEHDQMSGKYAVNLDPLDGSTNIDVNLAIGTIFSVHKKISPGSKGSEEDCVQKGSLQVAAGYLIYGSSTMLVYSTGLGVYGFTLDQGVGEFFLSHDKMTFPERTTLYSINESNSQYWDHPTAEYVQYIKMIDPATSRPLNARYVGSLVADFHRNLLKGGIFLYPADSKDPDRREGKLRLLFEAAPLAFIAQQAGGYASTGKESILDIQPTSLHQRVPFIVGNQKEVKRYEEFVNRFSKNRV